MSRAQNTKLVQAITVTFSFDMLEKARHSELKTYLFRKSLSVSVFRTDLVALSRQCTRFICSSVFMFYFYFFSFCYSSVGQLSGQLLEEREIVID